MNANSLISHRMFVAALTQESADPQQGADAGRREHPAPEISTQNEWMEAYGAEVRAAAAARQLIASGRSGV